MEFSKDELKKFWNIVPRDIVKILRRFKNLFSLIIVPPWGHQLEWIDTLRPSLPGLRKRLLHPWSDHLTTQLDHQDAMNFHGSAEVVSLLREVVPVIKEAYVFNMDTSWLPIACGLTPSKQSQLYCSSHVGLTSLRLDIETDRLTMLTLHRCSLQDITWFVPVFTHLRLLDLRNLTARDRSESTLFSITLNNDLYPQLESLTMSSLDLFPRDCFMILQAMRQLNNLRYFALRSVHVHCKDTDIGKSFSLDAKYDGTDLLKDGLLKFVAGHNVDENLLWMQWENMFHE
jgi:hypothetical protein